MKGRPTKNWIIVCIFLCTCLFSTFSVCHAGGIDVTANVEIVKSLYNYNRQTSQSYFDATLKNLSANPLNYPFTVVVESLTPSEVTVANPTGYTPEGKPYFTYSNDSGPTPLMPGTVTMPRRWSFYNPNRKRFYFTASVWIESGNRTPTANAGPDQTVPLGALVTLNGSGSTDPDGDSLTYHWAFLSTPTGSAATLSNPAGAVPTFIADRPGPYELQLVVSDGTLSSTPDTITVTTQNSRPSANAGPDQTGYTGALITLDGRGSSDADGHMLSYLWTFLSRPTGSAAALANPLSAMPSFTIDKFGTYELQLVVNDGFIDSVPDTVLVSTLNSMPVANAGPDQSVQRNAVVNLNGAASSDVDGNPLTFSWSLTKPGGSSAVLVDPTSVTPHFTADMPGEYIAQLIVNDGFVNSAPDTVLITTSNSAPTAEAGVDQTVAWGALVHLSGSGTDPDGDLLYFNWAITSAPSGSTAALSDPNVPAPSFTVDIPGDYIIRLIINDGIQNSAPDTVVISASNSRPVAEAGPNQTAPVGATVTLNGSASSDGDGNSLTYSWALTTKPPGSSAILLNPASVSPTFSIDLPGEYIAQLIVSDGFLNSLPDTVTISTSNTAPVANAGPDQTVHWNVNVVLDGSTSSDVDGNPLTFLWSFVTKPVGSTAAISDATIVNPGFKADLPGDYIIQLVVNDGFISSTPDTVHITTSNTTPVANAGPDQPLIYVGNTVTLDGGGSSDADGDTLTFYWSLLNKPGGSSADLADPNLARPTFVADRAGTYVAQLIVNDGVTNSLADTVVISTRNSPPVANAGPDQTAYVGDLVTLNGSGSTDVDGNPLTYAWSIIERPSGSGAIVSDAAAIQPTFTVDRFGTYVVQLIVNDGTVNGAPDNVQISTLNSKPVAEAGPPQTVHVHSPVTLDGSLSSDVDGQPLSYLWAFTSRPPGSNANLTGANTASPTFTADVVGDYIIQLVVSDGTLSSNPDTVTITTTNSRPVANAGPDQVVFVRNNVELNGLGSNDADGDPLTYSWSLIARPAGSAATLDNPVSATPSFVPDVIGQYVAQLIVNDLTLDSAPDTVLITAQSVPPTRVTLTPSPGEMLTRDTKAMTVTLDQPATGGGQAVGIAYGSALVSGPASVTVPETLISATFSITSGNQAGPVVLTASATGLVESASTITVQRRTFTLSSPLVGIDRTVEGTITLAQPAPSDGATFAMSVGSTSVLTVSPSNVTIPAGQTVGTFQLTGGNSVAFSSVTADGTANGYESKSLEVTVTNRLIDVATAKDMALGETYSFPVLIAPDAAPAGGVQIAVSSSNSSLVEVLTPTVTVPGGAFQTTATVRASASAKGSADITASNPSFAPDKMQVTVTASLNILETSTNFAQSETEDIFIHLDSGAAPYPVATPVSVTLTSADPACVATASPIAIPIGATFAPATLSYGGSATLPCTTTVTATNALFGTDTVSVTVGQTPDLGGITIADNHHGDRRTGSGLQVPYQLTLATGNHGGVKVQIQSSNPAVARVAASATAIGKPVVEVNIPNGTTTASFYVQGVSTAAGSASITARSPRFTVGTQSVDVVPGAFRLLGLPENTTTLSTDDPFYVQTGYIHSNGTTFRYAYVSGAAPLAVTFTSSNTAVGQVKTSSDTESPVTVTVPVNTYYSPQTVAGGGAAFDPLTGGTTTVAATAAGFSASSATVNVSQPTITLYDNHHGDYRIGGGLQVPWYLQLGGADHGGVTVRVSSSNTGLARVSASAATAGSEYIDLAIPNGTTTANFYVQGVPGATGTATLSATQSLFSTGTHTVDVVPGAFRLLGLPENTTTLSTDDPFYVQTGYIHSNGSTFRYAYVSGAAPLAVTFTSSDTAVGQVKTSSDTESPVTVTVPVNTYYSPQSVAGGGAAFDPLTGGTTTVAATATGFSASSATVNVSQPAITLYDNHHGDYRIGGGLQVPWYLQLGGADHGGVTVRVSSSNAGLARVSASAATAGSEYIDLVIPNGTTTANFYVQGVPGATGTATLSATQSLFSTGTHTVDVVPGAFRLFGLPENTTTLSTDDPFYVQTGYIHSNGSSFRWAYVSGAAPLAVTFTSSDTAVGQVKTSSDTESPVTVTMPVNTYYSPQSVAGGGAAFDPLTGGTTTVAATAAGFSASSATVNVSQPTITLYDNHHGDYRIGGGLQVPWYLQLGGADHGGVTVRVSCSNAGLARVSASAATAGSEYIDLVIPDGTTTANFYVQGVPGATGTATLSATQSLFSTGTHTVDVVPGAFQLFGLPENTTTLSTDDPFYVQTGYIHSNGTSFRWAYVSGAAPLAVTFTSSDTAVGQVKTSSDTESPVTVTMPVNTYYSPQTVAGGGAAFDPLTGGTTTVEATAAGFSASSATVNVLQPTLTLYDNHHGDYRIGGGLQVPWYLQLGGSAHGGVTVRVASGDTLRVLVSPNATTAGTSFIDVFVPDGQTTFAFYVQGINGVTGNVTLTASNAAFADGTATVEVVPAVLQIMNLSTSTTAGAADDPFQVRTGYVHSNGTSFRYAPVSPAGPIHVLLTSSNEAVGLLRTAAEYLSQVTVDVQPNTYDSPATVIAGGVAFDPLSDGTTMVSASSIGFNNAWSQASTTVTVAP
ncbi:MAG: PKD domain-containing protein [Syntrophobacteraceae bacterium]